MSKTTKIIVWIVVLVLVIWGITAIFGGVSTPQETGPIKMGVTLPLSGDAAFYGEPARNIVAIAVEEINADGGINGRQIEMIYEDGKCTGATAASAVQKLVNVDKVQVVIGGFCSSESLAAIPVVEQAKVALFSPSSSSPDLTDKSPLFFRNYPSDASQGQTLADVAYNKKGWKKIVFIQEQTDYSLGLYRSFAESFQTLGGTIVSKEEFPSNSTDFRASLSKLRAQNADALFIDVQTPSSAQRILKQVKDLKWGPKLLVSDVLLDPALVKDNKDLLEGAIGAEFGFDANNPKFVHMNDAYKAKYGIDAPYPSYAQTEYDALYIVKDAILAVGYDGQKIANWAHKLSNWQGASGSVTIGSNGDRIGGHTARIVENGILVPLK